MSDVAIFDEERKKWLQYDKDTEVLIKHISKEELNEISDKVPRRKQRRPDRIFQGYTIVDSAMPRSMGGARSGTRRKRV